MSQGIEHGRSLLDTVQHASVLTPLWQEVLRHIRPDSSRTEQRLHLYERVGHCLADAFVGSRVSQAAEQSA